MGNTIPTILKSGDVIGKYKVIRCLGVGGMGEVHLVLHQQLNVYRALKLLRPEAVADSSVFVERFMREARIASRIQHPNIVSVMDVENDPVSGFCYIVMEYVDGSTLESVLRNGPLSPDQAVHVISEVSKGLAAASELGMVHRDIKPSNIMISQDGQVKLSDLGIAKACGDDVGVTLTMANSVVGTPAYASPEQCRSAHDVDVRADIYSLGVTLYEMVTGLVPFDGTNAFDIIAHVINDEPTSPRRLNPNVSPELEQLILRMMAKDPEQRPRNITELQELLKPFLAASTDIPPELKKLIHEHVEREVQARTSTMITTYRKRQTWERVIALSVLIALLSAVCIFFIYRSERSRLEIRRWKAEAAKLENEKKELAVQIMSLKNQMEHTRKNYLDTTDKLEKTIQAQKLELVSLKNMQSARSANPPVRTEPAQVKAEEPASADVSGSKENQSPILPSNNIPATIEERIAHVETRLRELRQSPGSDDFSQTRIRIRIEQLKQLRSQQRVRDQARTMRQQRSFDEEKTRKVQEKFARHTKERTDWGYNKKDLQFAEGLIADLRSNEVDPNLTVTDSTYSRYSGPLIMSVLSGRIQLADRIVAVLLSRGADTAPLAQNKTLLQETGTGGAAKAAAMILTSGGFDSMTGILLPVSRRRPFPKELIKELLYLDHNVIERDKDGNTALHLAAGAGDKDTVTMLVALDADVNARNRRGETPLFAAARNAQEPIVQLLQKLGADPRWKNSAGKSFMEIESTPEDRRESMNDPRRTPSAESAASAQPPVSAAPDVRQENPAKMSLEEYREKELAVRRKYLSAMREIRRNQNELVQAMKRLDAAKIKEFFRRYDISFEELSYLRFSIPLNDFPPIRSGQILNAAIGYNLNLSGWDTGKIHEYLSKCCRAGHRIDSFFLLGSVSNIIATSHMQDKLDRNRLDILEFLLNRPDMIQFSPNIPVSSAVSQRRFLMNRVFVSRLATSADFPSWLERIVRQGRLKPAELQNETGISLLDQAYLHFYLLDSLTPAHLQCLKNLERYGVRYQLLNESDRKLIAAIRESDLRKVERLIREEGADPRKSYSTWGNALFIASASTIKYNPEIIRLLLKSGSPVTVENSFRRTPLAAAVEHNETDLIQRLLRCGAGRQQDYYALQAACRRGNTEIAELLLKNGTEPKSFFRVSGSGNGKQIRFYDNELLFDALESKNTRIAILLIEKNVDLTMRRSGKTPLEIAEQDPALKRVANLIRKKLRENPAATSAAPVPLQRTVPSGPDQSSRLVEFARQSSDGIPDLTHWIKAPAKDWHIHFGQAWKEAVKQGKMLLILQVNPRSFPLFLNDASRKRFLFRNFVPLFYYYRPEPQAPEEQKRHIELTGQAAGMMRGWPQTKIFKTDGRQVIAFSGFPLHEKKNYMSILTDVVAGKKPAVLTATKAPAAKRMQKRKQ